MTKHLISSADLSRAEVEDILETAASMHDLQRREVKKVPTLRGRTIINFFFEDSTRTRRLVRDRGQVDVGRHHQPLGQGLLDEQGREPAGHGHDRRRHGRRRPRHPAQRVGRLPPGRAVGPVQRHQRGRRHPRAPDAGPARRLHAAHPPRRPRRQARRHRRRPDPLPGLPQQRHHAEDPRRTRHRRRSAHAHAERYRGVERGRRLRHEPGTSTPSSTARASTAPSTPS